MTTNSVLVENPDPIDHILLGVEEGEEPEEREEIPELDRIKRTTIYLLGIDVIADMIEFAYMKSPLYLIMVFFTLCGIAGIQNEQKYIIKLYLTYTTLLVCTKSILFYTTHYFIILLGIIVDTSCILMVIQTYNKLV